MPGVGWGLARSRHMHPRTWQPVARWREIEMEHINGTYLVHNGREQKKVKVSSKMVGHKFGEFSFTRTKPHGGRSTVEGSEPGAGLGLGLGRG